jgi:hypothetical protein
VRRDWKEFSVSFREGPDDVVDLNKVGADRQADEDFERDPDRDQAAGAVAAAVCKQGDQPPDAGADPAKRQRQGREPGIDGRQVQRDQQGR